MRKYGHIIVSRELHEELRQLARKEGRTIMGMLMFLIDYYKSR